MALFALSGCVALGPQAAAIVAADLSPVLPGLGGQAAVVSAAPGAGVPRIFEVPELRRIAARFQVAGTPAGPICFERPVASPDPARLLAAMRGQLPQAQIEILEYGRMPAPAGAIEFPLSGLHRDRADGIWSGAVVYGGGRRFALWARVSVSVAEVRVLAAGPLRPGPAIDATQLRAETREVFPGEKGFATSIDMVAGRTPRLPIPAGAPIRLDWLAPAQDVARGEPVQVEVYSGAALLRFEATAEAAGSVGSVIPVTNPVSMKRFPARIEGRGRVSVGKGPS